MSGRRAVVLVVVAVAAVLALPVLLVVGPIVLVLVASVAHDEDEQGRQDVARIRDGLVRELQTSRPPTSGTSGVPGDEVALDVAVERVDGARLLQVRVSPPREAVLLVSLVHRPMTTGFDPNPRDSYACLEVVLRGGDPTGLSVPPPVGSRVVADRDVPCPDEVRFSGDGGGGDGDTLDRLRKPRRVGVGAG